MATDGMDKDNTKSKDNSRGTTSASKSKNDSANNRDGGQGKDKSDSPQDKSAKSSGPGGKKSGPNTESIEQAQSTYDSYKEYAESRRAAMRDIESLNRAASWAAQNWTGSHVDGTTGEIGSLADPTIGDRITEYLTPVDKTVTVTPAGSVQKANALDLGELAALGVGAVTGPLGGLIAGRLADDRLGHVAMGNMLGSFANSISSALGGGGVSSGGRPDNSQQNGGPGLSSGKDKNAKSSSSQTSSKEKSKPSEVDPSEIFNQLVQLFQQYQPASMPTFSLLPNSFGRR